MITGLNWDILKLDKAYELRGFYFNDLRSSATVGEKKEGLGRAIAEETLDVFLPILALLTYYLLILMISISQRK